MMPKPIQAEQYQVAKMEGIDSICATEGIDAIYATIEKVIKVGGPDFLSLSPEQLSLLYMLAYHLYENGKYTDSKKIFRFLTMCEPHERRYWMGLAASYALVKDYAGALECYSVAAIQEPDDPYVHLYAADCFFGQGQIETGIRTLESAISAAKKSHATSLLTQLENMHQAWNERFAKFSKGGQS